MFKSPNKKNSVDDKIHLLNRNFNFFRAFKVVSIAFKFNGCCIFTFFG